MREGFAFIEYPYSKEIVKVPGTLEKALKFYDKYKLSHRRLFYDYCDGRELDDNKALGKSVRPNPVKPSHKFCRCFCPKNRIDKNYRIRRIDFLLF